MAFDRVWKFALAGMIFAAASTLDARQYRHCVFAFGIGVAINALVAVGMKSGLVPIVSSAQIGQKFGIFTTTPTTPAAMMVNANYLAAAAVLAIVPLIVCGGRIWGRVVAILCFPALVLALSKAAVVGIAGTAVAAMWRLSRKVAVAILVISVGALCAYPFTLGVDGYGNSGFMHIKVKNRIVLAANTASGITVFGHGAGSFWPIYPKYANSVLDASQTEYSFNRRPRTAHNDFLTIAFEGGVVALALWLAFIAIILRRTIETREKLAAWLTTVAFLALGLFHFAAFLPHSLFVAMLHAGYLAQKRPSK